MYHPNLNPGGFLNRTQASPEVAGGKLASPCSDRVLVRTAAVYLATVLEYLVDDDSGGNEGLREEEEADEPEWSGGMVGGSWKQG